MAAFGRVALFDSGESFVARIEKVLIWSGWLRISHLSIGLSVLVLLASGWLLQSAPSLAADASDMHYLAAGVLLFGLALRILLMFVGSPVEKFGQLMPEDDEWRAVKDTLMFYLSFGRGQLPRWYAHNPFWKPLYLLLYLCLIVLVLTGWLRVDTPVVFGWYLPNAHGIFATAVAWLTFLHIFAVILHDYRGDSADISAIVNGNRHFVIEEQPTGKFEPVATINITDIGRSEKDR